jgi:RHS repeat-associated protein
MGYEKDTESGLDFAQARYFASGHGRLTTVDPENAGAMEDDPQSWNGYAYGGNNPILFVDPDGREYLLCDKDRKNCVTQTDEIVKGAQRKLPGSFR